MVKLLVLIIATISLVFVAYKMIGNSVKKMLVSVTNDCSAKILGITSTNNTYPPLLDVLVRLDDDLSKLGIKLNADMRGYLNDM